MPTATPRDLFFDQLRDLHSVETQLVHSLPTLAARAAYPRLAAIVAQHADETVRQAALIASIFAAHQVGIGDDRSKAMEGLIAGGDAHLDGVEIAETRDLMMIAHCLRIEHYEVAAYGITLRLAKQLGLGEEAALLSGILEEEKRTIIQLELLEPLLFERAGPLVVV